MENQIPATTQAAIHTLLIGAGKLLDVAAVKIGLNKADLSATDPAALLIGDMVEPAFTGYSQKAITAWTASTRSTGQKYLAGTPVLWTATVVAVSETIYGEFLIDTDSGDLVSYKPYDEPKVVNHVGQTYEATPEFSIGNLGVAELQSSTS